MKPYYTERGYWIFALIVAILAMVIYSLTSSAQRTNPEINIDSAKARKHRDFRSVIAANSKLSDSERLNDIQLNLYRYSRSYSTGTSLMGLGLGLTGVGVATTFTGNNNDPVVPAATLIGGGILVGIGWIFQQTAIKFIRRASGSP